MLKVVHVSYLLIYSLGIAVPPIGGKYIEGELNTWENWAFMARFCFLSEAGQFEYYIEYEEDQGTPNILLYYDEADQWPAVYKSNKNCHEREEVLRPEQNQIVNLSTRFPHADTAGCRVPPKPPTTPRMRQPNPTYIVPTLSTKPTTTVGTTTTTTKQTTPAGTTIVTKKVTITFRESEGEDYSTTEGATSQQPLTTGWFSDYTTSYATDDATPTPIKYQSMHTSPPSDSDARAITSNYDDVTSGLTSTDYLNINDKLRLTTLYESDDSGTTQFYGTDVVNLHEATNETIRRRRSAPPISRFREQTSRAAVKQVPRTITCRNARRFRTARERWWFIAVSNCRANRGIHIRYRMLMTNGDPGDYWHEHFSADEFYVLPVLMAFAVAYSFLLLAIIICSIELKSRQLLHSTYKLFVFSALIQFVGIIFKSMCYLKYAVNGIGSPSLRIVGNMFMGMSETCFLLLLLLLAKGYTVTRGRLPLSAGVKVTIFMCLYVVTYICLFIYEAKVFDPGEVLYTYESPAGYGLIILRIAAWCMFIYSTIFTLKHYPEKANFYYPFNVLGTLWYIAGPAFIVSANTYVDKWVRESVVCAVLLFITFGGHLMFLLLTMPSVANKNFPYHVRTTQIGVMEQCGNIGGVSSIEQFTHHAYEPTSLSHQVLDSQAAAAAMIVPLSRRTEDLFSGLYSQQMYTSTSATRGTQGGGGGNDVAIGMEETSMENVLSWSIAKNFNSLDPPRMNRRMSEAIQETRRNNDQTLSRQETAEISETNGLQDWIRDVPVELFTVSKTVAIKDNNKDNKVNNVNNVNSKTKSPTQSTSDSEVTDTPGNPSVLRTHSPD